MKKILCISFLLALIVCFAACGFDVVDGPDSSEPTEPPYDHFHCVCAQTAVNVGNHESCADKTGWVSVSTNQELTEAIRTAQTEPVCVYLTADLVCSSSVQILPGAEVSICLNGYALSMDVDNYGTLSVTDCAKNPGTWTSHKDSTVRGYSESVFNLYAVTVTIGATSAKTQVVTISGHSVARYQLGEDNVYFNMYSGEIYNPNQTSIPGANLYVGLRGVFNMYDGKIGEANAVVINDENYTRGGSIALYGSYSVMNMYDGVISDGKITTEKPGDSAGGNIGTYRGELRIYGGTIKNGYACGNGGNIAVSNASTQLHLENVIVSGGECGSFGGNIYISGASDIAVNLKNAIISDGYAKAAGGNIYFTSYACTIDSCTISGGRSDNEPGGGLAVDGNEKCVVTLKGDNVFSNNRGSDVLMCYRDAGMSRLSISGITGTDEIMVAGSMLSGRHVFTCDTHPDVFSVLKAAAGFKIGESGGLLEISKGFISNNEATAPKGGAVADFMPGCS